MSVEHSSDIDNPTSSSFPQSPEQIAEKLQQCGDTIREHVVNASKCGQSFDETERAVWNLVLKTGFLAMELFTKLQGKGDLGDQAVSESGKTLRRSEKPTDTVVRSIFGEHAFQQYTYSPGKNKRIELHPISARMQLPEHRWSYLLQEFSQMFCVESAFNQAADNLELVFGAKFSIDTLEQTSQRMGVEADAFLDDLPTPKKKDEAELLVASADCKGVPLIKDDAAKVAAFETAKKRPGNRRMATVTSAYTVDPYVRTAEQIVAALFRDDKEPGTQSRKSKKKRPRPKHKHTSAHFPATFVDDDTEVPISGIHEGIAWLADQVSVRRKKLQVIILLMDGQQSLWEVAQLHLGDDPLVVPILDIIHVATYVWEASSLFEKSSEKRAAFTRERLLKILRGEVNGVIRGLRRMGSLGKLKGDKLKDLRRICGYFEKHKDRMRYDEYLAAGYPIASGVIEGACGHLVKDRMERSGMRWTLEAARSMLNVRAVFQSDYWDKFCKQRVTELSESTHPNRNMVCHYTPLTMAC
ncbi:ISKra4 family transposase [Stieleria varia]|uniref:ISKra4 family transposase n=1 Tax=Stieleria varia TaxID=2528005 RepID=UPI00313EEA85